MRVFEVMTEGTQTVKPAMSASEAWALMRLKHIHHLVVTDGHNIVGVLSERDLGGRIGASARAGRTVADLMTSPVVTAGKTDTRTTLRPAAAVAREWKAVIWKLLSVSLSGLDVTLRRRSKRLAAIQRT